MGYRQQALVEMDKPLVVLTKNDVGMALPGCLNTFRLAVKAIGVAIYGSLLSSIVSNMVPIKLARITSSRPLQELGQCHLFW